MDRAGGRLPRGQGCSDRKRLGGGVAASAASSQVGASQAASVPQGEAGAAQEGDPHQVSHGDSDQGHHCHAAGSRCFQMEESAE